MYLLYLPQKAFLLNDNSYLLGSCVSLGLGAVNAETPASGSKCKLIFFLIFPMFPVN